MPESNKKSVKQKIEEHIPTVVLGATVSGFALGIGSVETYKKTTEQKLIPVSEVTRLTDKDEAYDSLVQASDENKASLNAEIDALKISLASANKELTDLKKKQKAITTSTTLDPTKPLKLKVTASKNSEGGGDVVGTQPVNGWYLSKRCATDAGGCRVDMTLSVTRKNGTVFRNRQQGKFLLNAKTREWAFHIGDKVHREGIDRSGNKKTPENLIVFLADHPFGECAFSDTDTYNNEWYLSGLDLERGFNWQAINIGSQQENVNCEITFF